MTTPPPPDAAQALEERLIEVAKSVDTQLEALRKRIEWLEKATKHTWKCR